MSNTNTGTKIKSIHQLTLMLLASCALSACGAGERIANIGKPPPMSPIENPQARADYRPVSMPMPVPKESASKPNSLWDANRTTFFKDQRASTVGDILTVLVEIRDEAELGNRSSRSRNANESAGLDHFLGYEGSLGRVLPQAVDPSNLIGFGNDSAHTGRGSVEREEAITVRLAAVISQVLPNGNFVIHGNQEVRVNFEKRVLNVTGIIRPEDISVGNTVQHDQIAEARIVYGGEGQITDVQQPRYGHQLYDIVFPF